MTRIFAALSLAFFLAGPVLAQAAPATDDKPIDVTSDDAIMNAAIAEARATLPEFWAAFEAEAPGTDGFMLKLRLAEGSQGEHFWMKDIERGGGIIKGTLDNEPYYIKSVRKGQRMIIPEAGISDWLFYRNGKIVGNRTLIAVLHHMPAEEAAYWRTQFETPPP